MMLKNQGNSFKLLYDSREYEIPAGAFEINSVGFGYFIVETASKWGKNVIIVDDGGRVRTAGTDLDIDDKEEINAVEANARKEESEKIEDEDEEEEESEKVEDEKGEGEEKKTEVNSFFQSKKKNSAKTNKRTNFPNVPRTSKTGGNKK